MNFSTLSIQRPLPAILLFILLVIAGLFSFSRMAIQESPDIDIPVIIVNAVLPGASPSQLEAEVARKIENSLASIPQVRHISSTISDSSVETAIEFRVGKDVTEALIEVRDAISRVRADMPVELRDPVVGKAGNVNVPVVGYAITSSTRDPQALSWYIDSKVSKALLALPGVGRVRRVGGVNREVLVELDPVRMAALNVSAAVVSHQLQRVQQESPSGRANIGGQNQAVRTVGTVYSVDQVAALDMVLPDGRRIRLDQVARVSDTHAEPNSITLLDGKPVVGLEIMRSKGASEIVVAKAVAETVAQLAKADGNVVFAEAFNAVDAVQENYDGSMALLYEGALLTVLVVWFFLRDWRATLISAAALPLSVIPTFLVLHWMGYTLNMVTLLSLALVVGVLVDDAIVEIENIMRHLRMGKSPYQAALDAANEIGLAVVATTATLVAVFLPTAFLNDVIGQYFKQFGVTASVAVLASLVVARLLTPMMAAYFLKPTKERPESKMMRPYLSAVDWCLKHRKSTLTGATLFFVGSLALIPMLNSDFIPPADGVSTTIMLELPPGSTLQETLVSSEQARAELVKDRDVVQVYSQIGEGEMRSAVLTVSLKPRTTRSRKQQQINADLRDSLRGLVGVRVLVTGSDNGDEMSFALASEDPKALEAAATAIQREIRGIEGLGRIYSNVSLVRPELIITPDFARAADLGVTAAAIGETVRIATAGDYDQALSKLNLPERQLPIRVRLPESARQDLSALERLTVPGKAGNVPLMAVADLRMDSAPAKIDRRDRTRFVSIKVQLNGQREDAVMNKINQLPAMKNLPPSVKKAMLGDSERSGELAISFLVAISIGIVCVYMVLVLLFKGFMQPLTVMAALPLSIGGAFGALLLTGSSLSMPSSLGLLMLMGIAVKNSILLVEYALRHAGVNGASRHEVLIDACHKRVRPIIMTTVAMSAGMLPIAMGWGADASFRSPMAIAVIGGLLTSTLLSLLVIPVVFTYVDDLMIWWARPGFLARRASRRPHNIVPA